MMRGVGGGWGVLVVSSLLLVIVEMDGGVYNPLFALNILDPEIPACIGSL